jgi:sugar/nucleoside kinase (ribokinase family)
MTFDIAFIGHYTRDTIVYPHATRTVDGGGYFFGAAVAAQMGLRVAVITRLAAEEWGAVAKLEQMGVTMLGLIYPTTNLDQRTIELSSWAGPFDVADVADVPARAYAIAASSVCGEISPEVVEALAARGAHIALDVQGFMRVLRDGVVGHDAWPGKEAVLRHVTILKTDAFEAELLTGEVDRATAAHRLERRSSNQCSLNHARRAVLK